MIKYIAPGSFQGITEISYNIKDELGDIVFSGTVKITIEKPDINTVGNGTDNTDTGKTLKDYWWVPVVLLVGSLVTWGITKISKKRKNSV